MAFNGCCRCCCYCYCCCYYCCVFVLVSFQVILLLFFFYFFLNMLKYQCKISTQNRLTLGYVQLFARTTETIQTEGIKEKLKRIKTNEEYKKNIKANAQFTNKSERMHGKSMYNMNLRLKFTRSHTHTHTHHSIDLVI